MAITSDLVESQLGRHGYALVRRTSDHALYEHDGDRVVVPHQSGELSPWAARAIEWSLEPRLGPKWLTAPSPAPRVPSRCPTGGPPLQLRLVIRRDPDLRMWHAFVVEVPRILTCGRTLAETRRRAADAARVWFTDEAPIELEPCLTLDTETQGWLDHARVPTGSATRRAEACRHLGLLGLAGDDIAELLDGPPVVCDRT